MIYATENQPADSPLDFVWKIINFVILIIILYWFARKPISVAMKSSAENAKNQLDEARKAETCALAQMKEMREKLARLEEETREIVEKARQEAKTEKERILEEGIREMERMREHARFSIEQEYRKAEHQLREWVANESVKLAREQLEGKMSGTRQNKLVKEYLDQLRVDKEAS